MRSCQRTALAALLFTVGKPQAGLEQFREVVGLTPQDAEAWINFASANAQVGRMADALVAVNRARELAQAQGRTDLVQEADSLVTSIRGAPKN